MTDYWDYRQNRQIKELQEGMSAVSASLAAARSSTRRLQSELSKVSGSMEQRLTRLTAAFDAFVELSDLRMTLTLFDEHARVRHRARQLFGEHPLPGEPTDVDGYWLAPALAAVQATVDGTPGGAALELARTRDARRTSLFQVLAFVLLGQPDAVTTPLVAEAIPELEPNPALYQRALWLLAADGQLGAGGREWLLRKGIDGLAAVEGAEREAAVTAWLKAIKPERGASSAVPEEFGQAKELIAALDACERISVLRQWVSEALTEDAEPGGEVDPLAKRALELLVDEGSPLELPLLARERELRRVIESNGVKPSSGPDGWESPVGSMIELIRSDVDDREHPGRRALAVRISAAHLVEAAERLAEQARKPLPESAPARTSIGTITVSKSGPDQKSLDRAARRAARDVDNRRRKVAFGFGGAGVVLALLGIAGWGWFVPAGLAFVVAGWQWLADRADRAKAVEEAASTRARLRTEADDCVLKYQQACSDLDRRRARIEDELKALRVSLGG
jgi:hypothetical protein